MKSEKMAPCYCDSHYSSVTLSGPEIVETFLTLSLHVSGLCLLPISLLSSFISAPNDDHDHGQ